jgi:hypothetical protein
MSSVTKESDAGESSIDVDENGMGTAGVAAVGSVALALYFYYVRGEKQRGQFVGLWPATILGLAIYRRLGKIQARLEQSAE